MMKKFLYNLQIKSFIAGVMVTVMFSATLTWANTAGVMRELFYGVSINLNGQVLQLADIDRPFIVDGRTFLPVRAISEALDISVDWDGATRTVYVGTIPHGAPLFSTIPAFEGSGLRLDTVNMMRNPFANALNTGTYTYNGWNHRNLNGQYNTITGTIGRIDGSSTGASTISFIGDGRELASFTVDGSTHPTNISVDVRGVLILRIQINQGYNQARPAFANAMIQ